MKCYDKLVRDRIPEAIAAKGQPYTVHAADAQEYVTKLREKLQEEVAEFLESSDTEELADIMEVVYALAAMDGHTHASLEALRADKAAKKGGFAKRIILEES